MHYRSWWGMGNTRKLKRAIYKWSQESRKNRLRSLNRGIKNNKYWALFWTLWLCTERTSINRLGWVEKSVFLWFMSVYFILWSLHGIQSMPPLFAGGMVFAGLMGRSNSLWLKLSMTLDNASFLMWVHDLEILGNWQHNSITKELSLKTPRILSSNQNWLALSINPQE